MLTIREEQLVVLNAAVQKRFERRLLQRIAADFPKQHAAFGEEGTLDFIRRAIRTGAGFGITSEGGVTVLIELMMDFGETFERSPDREWARRMLAHPTLPAAVKLSVIRERMTARTQGRPLVLFQRQSSE